MINMTKNLSDKQWIYNDNPRRMGYMFIQSLWTVVIPTFALSMYQNLAMNLAKYPDIVKRIKEDRTLVPKFARESLRLAPLKGGIRDITEDIDYHGYKFDANGRILLYTYGANRDPKYFKNPLEFSLERDDEPLPVTLAYGPHHCTGDFLVKHFLEMIINSLLDRFDNFEITKEPELLPAMFGSTTVYKDLEFKFS
jgi:cytochrome P450